MLSTRQVAMRLGLLPRTLGRYIAAGKVPAPKIVQIGEARHQAWSEDDVERLRQLLPKIKNGRKTRYRKKQVTGIRPQAKGKTKRKERKGAQPRAAVTHKKK